MKNLQFLRDLKIMQNQQAQQTTTEAAETVTPVQ